ncbi:hydrogenase 2 operon protein HybA [Deferribacterales bacterium RsTz2092]|nr:hydrogenase [Deferribacterales bacterium]
MNDSRRHFLKASALGGVAIAAALLPSVTDAEEESEVSSDKPAVQGSWNKHVGMLYDSTLCVGCKACVYACRKANFDMDGTTELAPEDVTDPRWVNVTELDYRTKNIIKMYKSPDNSKIAFMKRQCMHCYKPGCVSACPVKAMTENEETGIIEYDKDKCIGCRYCQIACPFNIPAYEWHDKFGKITKCELCRETNLKTKGVPACVEVCPVKAVIFGTRQELLKIAKERILANSDRYVNKVYGEFDYGGTGVKYIAGVEFSKLGLPELPDYSYAAESEHIQHTLYKHMIAPLALYATLTAVSIYNQKKHDSEHRDDSHKGGGNDERT